MADLEKGCPRCRDYESIKEQLENAKSQRNKEVSDKLRSCEDHTKHLQKKLMTVGAAAVVGGTVLGKDFVDKIAEYIESFTNVTNAAGGLIGAAPAAPPTIAQVDQPKQEKKDEEKDEKDKDSDKDDAWALDIPDFASTGFEGFIAGSVLAGLYEEPTLIEQALTQPVTEPEELLEVDVELELADMEIETILDTPPILLAEIPVYPSPVQEPFVAIVPAPGVLAFMPFVLWFGSRGRKR